MADVLRLLQTADWSASRAVAVTTGAAEALAVDGVSVCLGSGPGGTEILASSDGMARDFEDLQLTLGEGPGPDCMAGGTAVRVPDLTRVRGDRWPVLLAEATDQAARAVFCFPLRLGAITLGVLTLVKARPGGLTSAQGDDATVLAGALTKRFLDRGNPVFPSPELLDPASFLHQAVVHQAAGMVSVQLAVPLAEALLRLRAHAYSTRRTLADTAQDIVARRLRLAPDPRTSPPAADKE